jgi:hypothetical protein
MREHDIQFWDNQDGTWKIDLYTPYARSKLRKGQIWVARKFTDAEMFRILLWALANEMRIDGPYDLTIDYL